MLSVRKATIEDAERILEIYGYYVENTAITFEYEVPSIEEFRERMNGIMAVYPYLVIERDGIIQGYAYAGPFSKRPAYQWACELSIYLDRNATKGGLGKMLYMALFDELQKMGIINVYASVACPVGEDDEYLTDNSACFHEHMGFRRVGEFYKCGYKFGRWYSVVWLEKLIGEHTDNPMFILENKEAKR